MTLLSECAGYVLYERGRRLIFIYRGTGLKGPLQFSLGLATICLVLNGAYQMYSSVSGGGGMLVLGASLLFFGLVTACGFVAVYRWGKRIEARPLDSYEPIVVVDRKKKVLLDGNGQELAPLTKVRFTTQLQLHTIVPALTVTWPEGRRVVLRGSPLKGPEHAMKVLRHYGLPA